MRITDDARSGRYTRCSGLVRTRYRVGAEERLAAVAPPDPRIITELGRRKVGEAEATEAKKRCRKGRWQGTWSHLLGGAGPDTDPDPPLG